MAEVLDLVGCRLFCVLRLSAWCGTVAALAKEPAVMGDFIRMKQQSVAAIGSSQATSYSMAHGALLLWHAKHHMICMSDERMTALPPLQCKCRQRGCLAECGVCACAAAVPGSDLHTAA